MQDKTNNKPLPPDMPVRIVAIDGRGGAGKSTLAEKLAKELGAEILHTDDFASWDNPVDWAQKFISEVIEPIKYGAKTLNYGRSSWGPEHHPSPIKDQPVTPIMIFEGVRSARQELRPYLTYTIWVETPREICMQRGLKRDGPDKREQWEEWFADEDIYFAYDDPKSYADIVINGF